MPAILLITSSKTKIKTLIEKNNNLLQVVFFLFFCRFLNLGELFSILQFQNTTLQFTIQNNCKCRADLNSFRSTFCSSVERNCCQSWIFEGPIRFSPILLKTYQLEIVKKVSSYLISHQTMQFVIVMSPEAEQGRENVQSDLLELHQLRDDEKCSLFKLIIGKQVQSSDKK